GLVRVGRTWLYVTRGIGFWGPPARVGSPPEITILTLRARPYAPGPPLCGGPVDSGGQGRARNVRIVISGGEPTRAGGPQNPIPRVT
ncbi:MAG TPA: hypothetical protein VM367_07845, partial [Pseudonocardia sp.]|nr:hypothetical protein [Pseudonocardia sp.]